MTYRSSPPPSKYSVGFTLIEALIGVALSVLVGGGVWAAQRQAFGTQALVRDALSAQTEARRALKDMTMLMREISSASDGSYALSQTVENSFVFYADSNGDGLKERVRYFLDGATLKKGTITPVGSPSLYDPAQEIVREIVHDVSNGTQPVFQYYDTSYNGSTPPLAFPVSVESVRLVKVTLIIDRNAQKLPEPFTLSTQITLRNLKDNL